MSKKKENEQSKKKRAYTRKEWESNSQHSLQTGQSTQFNIKKKKFYFSF